MADHTLMLDEMKRVKGRADRLILDDLLPKSHGVQEVDLLYRMMRDYPQRGGKGMRPFLCVTSCRAFGGEEEEAILTAASLELFQNWILSDLSRDHLLQLQPVELQQADHLDQPGREYLLLLDPNLQSGRKRTHSGPSVPPVVRN